MTKEIDQQKILLAHLNSNGDCLFASVVARQIKEIDFPGCHLTWAVNSRSKQTVLLNPFVDEIWEIPTATATATPEEWNDLLREAERRRQSGDFDRIFATQIVGDNLMNYDGGIRSSIYNNYPREISVPHQPIVRLDAAEVGRVREFAARHKLASFKHAVLIECAPASFAAALDFDSALEFARRMCVRRDDAIFILSSNKSFETPAPNIIDASVLTFRENAELTKYCTLFVGCASGIAWLATSDWAKKLLTVLIINEENAVLPSMVFDHEHLNLAVDHIIEIKSDERAMRKLGECVESIFAGDFAAARRQFHQKMRVRNFELFRIQLNRTIDAGELSFLPVLLRRYVKRNGFKSMFFTRSIRRLLAAAAPTIKNTIRKKFGKRILLGGEHRKQ